MAADVFYSWFVKGFSGTRAAGSVGSVVNTATPYINRAKPSTLEFPLEHQGHIKCSFCGRTMYLHLSAAIVNT